MNAEVVATISDKVIALLTECSVRIEKKEDQGVLWASPMNGSRINIVAKAPMLTTGKGVEDNFLVFMFCPESVFLEY
jgi:hypothetical protein